MTLRELQRMVKKSFVTFDELISEDGGPWLQIGDVAVLEEAVRELYICIDLCTNNAFRLFIFELQYQIHEALEAERQGLVKPPPDSDELEILSLEVCLASFHHVEGMHPF